MNLQPLKRFCAGSPLYGLNIPAERYTSSGIRFLRTTDIGDDGRLAGGDDGVFLDIGDVPAEYILREGDLLFSRSGTLGKSLLFHEHNAPTTHAGYLVRFRPNANNYPSYLSYCAQSRLMKDAIGADAVESTISNFNAERYANVRFPWWPLRTQRMIADYLDRETARIDALIMAKRRMMELAERRFEAYAQLACIGGIGEQVRRPSPSGLYGHVPCTWQETSLRHLDCEVQTGPFGSQLHADEYIEDGWPVVNPMNIINGRIIAAPGMTISSAKRAELSRHVLADGDIVFGRRGEMGRAGLVGPGQVGWVCGTGSLRLRLTSDALIPAYLKLLLQTSPARAYFSLASVGSTMENLNSEIVLAFPALVPSRSEQIAIVEKVQQSSDRTELLVKVLRQQVDLLQERRRALITAAVTGQLDIPEAA